MEHGNPIWTIDVFGLPITFNLSTALMIVISSLIVFLIAFFMTRNLAVKPTGKSQVLMEVLMNFVKGIISGNMAWKQGGRFHFLALTLILYIFVSNMLGLPFAFVAPMMTMTSGGSHRRRIHIQPYARLASLRKHLRW